MIMPGKHNSVISAMVAVWKIIRKRNHGTPSASVAVMWPLPSSLYFSKCDQSIPFIPHTHISPYPHPHIHPHIHTGCSRAPHTPHTPQSKASRLTSCSTNELCANNQMARLFCIRQTITSWPRPLCTVDYLCAYVCVRACMCVCVCTCDTVWMNSSVFMTVQTFSSVCGHHAVCTVMLSVLSLPLCNAKLCNFIVTVCLFVVFWQWIQK